MRCDASTRWVTWAQEGLKNVRSSAGLNLFSLCDNLKLLLRSITTWPAESCRAYATLLFVINYSIKRNHKRIATTTIEQCMFMGQSARLRRRNCENPTVISYHDEQNYSHSWVHSDASANSKREGPSGAWTSWSAKKAENFPFNYRTRNLIKFQFFFQSYACPHSSLQAFKSRKYPEMSKKFFFVHSLFSPMQTLTCLMTSACCLLHFIVTMN